MKFTGKILIVGFVFMIEEIIILNCYKMDNCSFFVITKFGTRIVFFCVNQLSMKPEN
jgi:hypothetical protein